MVTIGIDPHKSSHTAAALDADGGSLSELRLRADGATLSRLLAWAGGWPERVWAIEGAGGLGRLLAQQLVAAGETVLDVPSALAARSRAGTWSWPQDRRDRRAQRRCGCPAARRPTRGRRRDHSSVLRLLSDRRDELTGE